MVSPFGNTLVGAEESGDKIILNHAEQVDTILASNKEERIQNPNPAPIGQAKWRKVGSIPALLLVAHPEWVDEPALALAFLRSSEGEVYRTVSNV